jgi:hypothetical protein
MAFAEKFREKWMPLLDIAENDPLKATEAFVKGVDSYPTVLIASKRSHPKSPVLHRPEISSKKTLAELGYVVKVGPALGYTPAFVLDADESDVEPELLLPWLDASELSEDGGIAWRGRRVVLMYGTDGKLVDLRRFPRLHARLRRFREALDRRSIVRNGAPWIRPIDRFRAADWAEPKLLIPELAKAPRVAMDPSGAIPSHGVYAIFSQGGDLSKLHKKLEGGRLDRLLHGIAPRVKGGYVRCYKRFLNQIHL